MFLYWSPKKGLYFASGVIQTNVDANPPDNWLDMQYSPIFDQNRNHQICNNEPTLQHQNGDHLGQDNEFSSESRNNSISDYEINVNQTDNSMEDSKINDNNVVEGFYNVSKLYLFYVDCE